MNNSDDLEDSANVFLESFFDVEYKRNKILFDNMQNIYTFICYFYRYMEYVDIEPLDIRNDLKNDVCSAEVLIDNFYKSINDSFRFNDVISNGTFDIIKTNSPNNTLDYELSFGNNNYKTNNNNVHKTINVYNNGLITDTIIWVHELSHYRNQPSEKRGEVNDILTELLAFTEEFLYIDYLENNGYKSTAINYKIIEYNNLLYNICNSYYAVRIYLLYYLLGEVSRDNYIYLYGNDGNYEKSLEAFISEKEKQQTAIFRMLYYSVGLMSLYNYVEYKKNNVFLNRIEMLNKAILNNSISLNDALDMINIRLDKESLDKILENINILRENIIKGSNILKLKR